MLKKITSLVLLMLMMVVVVTSHASIKYCLCNDVFVFEDTGNCPLVECQAGELSHVADLEAIDSCTGCCGNDEISQVAGDENFASLECSTCMLKLTFPIEECLVSSSSVELDGSLDVSNTSDDNVHSGLITLEVENIRLLNSQLSVRGSPPDADSYCRQTLPIYIRHSAWLI